MDDRKQRIEELFHEAARLQVSARAGFLDRACGGDATLRREVEALLAIASVPTLAGGSPPMLAETAGEERGNERGEERGERHDPVLAEGTRVGEFQIRRLLGEGTMGQVYLAQDTTLGRRVALKFTKRAVMESYGVERFLDEARATASFNHPHIVTLYAVGEHEGRPYLALEYIDGQSLRVRLAAGPLPMREALQCGRAIADAIAEAHRRGLVHADLKPENILIPSDGRVRVVDFGLARLAQGAPNATSGTPAYMAPERWRGTSPTGAIDVWALGVMLHELVAGVRPIPDQAFMQLMVGTAPLELPALPETPWAQLVRDCIALDPAARPTAEEVVRRLTALLGPYDAAAGEEARAAAGPAGQVRELATELADDEVRLARGLLLSLIGPDGTRHRRRRGELLDAAPPGARQAVGQLIDRFIERRLVVATSDGTNAARDDAVIEIAPEAIDAAWPQLARSLGKTHVRRLRLALLEVTAPRKASDTTPPTVDHTSDTSATETPPTLDALPFEGRRETMAALIHSGCAAVATRTPTLVTIRGDDGIGKTRLAAALHHAMTEAIPAARVLSLRCQDPSVGEVDGALRALLRRLIGPVRRREMREQLQAQVGDAWPAVALTLGWLGLDAPELLPLAQAPGALRIATIEATGRLIRRAAQQAPLCLIVDDAHLADPTTLDAIELATLDRGSAAGAAGAAPLWICVLAGPSFDAERPAFGERAARAEEIELEPLPDAAAGELCRTLLHPAENLPAQVIEMITARAHGNAMVLGELCRALKSEGIVRQERTGAWILETDRVNAWPHTPRLQWLAERELRRLPPDLAGHAQLAAVLGPKFTATDMIGVQRMLEASPAADRFPLHPMEALAQLDRAQLLSVRRNCEFRNAMLCEAVRAAIPEPLRVELHRAAFEHYRDLRGVREERRRPRLAFHAAEAGLREEAARAYEALAADYLDRHRYVEAEGSFSRMLALVDGAPLRQTAHHGRGLARYRTGRYEDALDDLHRAHELAAELGDRRAQRTILLDEAAVLDWMWSHRRSAELVDQAIALAGDDLDPVTAARIATGRARSLWRLGKRVEAHASLLEAVLRAEAAGPAAYESLILSLVMLGTVLCGLGQLPEAHEAFDRALATARAQGDRLHELTALNNRRRVWIAEQDVARAAADLHALLEIGRTLGLVLVELVGTYNLGELLYQAGDADAAWPHVEHAVALAARRADLQPRPVARLLELRLLAFEGHWQEAHALGAAIAELHRSARAEGRSDAELLPGEEVLLDAVLLASTGGGAEAWAEVRERSARCSEEQQPIEVIEMQALGALRAGDLAGARRALEEALAVAQRIPNVMEARLRRRLAQL